MDKLRQWYWSVHSGCLCSSTLQFRGPKGTALLSLPLLPAFFHAINSCERVIHNTGISHDLQRDELEICEQKVRPDQLGGKWMIFPLLRPWYTVVSLNARGRSGKLFSASVAEPGITPVLVSHVAVRSRLVVRLQAVSENKCRRIASTWLLACLGVCRLAQWGANLLSWRYSGEDWTQSWVMCSTGPCLSREVGVENLLWSLPTLLFCETSAWFSHLRESWGGKKAPREILGGLSLPLPPWEPLW